MNAELLPEQEDLLALLVEADRGVQPRRHFRFTQISSRGGPRGFHPGLPGGRGQTRVSLGDLEELVHRRFLRRLATSGQDEWHLTITPEGFARYAEIRERRGQPIEHVEEEVRRYLDGPIRDRYPQAAEQWAQAEHLLWTSEPEESATQIGHLCREAMQAFATELVRRHEVVDVDPEAGPTPKIRAVLGRLGEQLGERERAALEALINWWSAVYDLANRQEHGGQRDEALVFEDSRRLVFQTAVTMSEIDRSVSR